MKSNVKVKWKKVKSDFYLERWEAHLDFGVKDERGRSVGCDLFATTEPLRDGRSYYNHTDCDWTFGSIQSTRNKEKFGAITDSVNGKESLSGIEQAKDSAEKKALSSMQRVLAKAAKSNGVYKTK